MTGDGVGVPEWPQTRGWSRLPLRGARGPMLVALAAVVVFAALGGFGPAGGGPAARPKYTKLPDPCALVSEASLAKYAPGAQVSLPGLIVDASGLLGNCVWLGGGWYVEVSDTISPSAAQAARLLPVPSGTSVSLDGSLGDTATAVMDSGRWGATLTVSVLSGNATLAVSYTSYLHPAASSLQAGATALARDALAAFGSAPGDNATPLGQFAPTSPGVPYAAPASACALLSPVLLGTYLHGDTADPADTVSLSAGRTMVTDCGWAGSGGDMTVSIAVLRRYPSPQACPPQYVQIMCQGDMTGGMEAVWGATVQRIPDLGDQSIATIGKLGGPAYVIMTTQSGNAELSLNLSWPGQPGRSAEVTEATAITREILAALPLSGQPAN